MAWRNKFKQHKAFKKELIKKFMLVTWYHKIWWDWCVPEDKKRNRTVFY